jgi:hypothetical protein
MKKLFRKIRKIPDYTVRCYLTLRCGGLCEFCSAQVPQAGEARRAVRIPAEQWAEGLNRRARHTILAGGEPFLYPGFYKLVNLLEPSYKVEIYTNLQQDVVPFIYAAKRSFQFLISLHPGTDLDKWREYVDLLSQSGHSLRFHVVRMPGYEQLAEFLKSSGIVGKFKTALQGDQRSGPKSAGPQTNREHPLVNCRSRIILFGPDGYRYHCVHKIVTGDKSGRFEHITQNDGNIETEIDCREFGLCAGCDNNIEGRVIDVS